MNLGFVTSGDWGAIATTNLSLLIFAGLIILGAFSFLTSFAIIPSLVATHKLPAEPRVIRPLLYVIALAAFALALVGLIVALANAFTAIERLYPRWWI